MNVDGLLTIYDRVAEAPDAIPRLRRLVLDLAARGKLVTQNPADEPASELLKRIAAEKARLVKAGKIRKPKPPELIESADEPFALPMSWKWVRLADILTKLTDGTHHSPSNGPTGDFLYITAKNIKNDGVMLDDVTYVSRDVHEEIYARCNPELGDILYIKDGATTGVVAVNSLDEPFSLLSSVALLKLPSCLFNRLIVEFLRSPFFYDQMRGFMKGAAITRVTLNRMGPALFPLPPLAEQHRIVAKVDELMALCDRLEAARTAREATRDRLTTASLARLTAPDTDAETFRTHARVALEALAPLTTRPDQIRTLRQTILNLAVRGQLVEQDPADEPAARFLSALTVKKAEQLRLRSMRGDKELPAVSDDEAPFGLPFGWKWVRTQEISLKISDGVHQKPHYVPTGIPFITVKNLTEGPGLSFRETKFVSEADHYEFIKRTHPERGDLLITKDGTIGVTRVVDTDREFSVFVSVALVKMVDYRIASFLALCFNSEAVQAQISPKGAALKHLHLVDLRKLPVPLPPLAEQHRIVAKVDALMALCGQLEASLAAADTTRRRLLETLLHDALQPAQATLEAAE